MSRVPIHNHTNIHQGGKIGGPAAIDGIDLTLIGSTTDDGTTGGTVGGTTTTDSMVPYYIPVDHTFTVPIYKQALFATPIEADGVLTVLGMLIGVD